MNKVSCFEKVGKRNGFSRGFDFSIRKVVAFDNQGQNDFSAQYEVRVNNVKDIYHTTYLNPNAEPENGNHLNMVNNNHSLENDIQVAINEHLWDFLGQYEDFDYVPLSKTVKALKADYGVKLEVKNK